jgi:hypothetical protein
VEFTAEPVKFSGWLPGAVHMTDIVSLASKLIYT